jgi:hypothetical protein
MVMVVVLLSFGAPPGGGTASVGDTGEPPLNGA